MSVYWGADAMRVSLGAKETCDMLCTVHAREGGGHGRRCARCGRSEVVVVGERERGKRARGGGASAAEPPRASAVPWRRLTKAGTVSPPNCWGAQTPAQARPSPSPGQSPPANFHVWSHRAGSPRPPLTRPIPFYGRIARPPASPWGSWPRNTL